MRVAAKAAQQKRLDADPWNTLKPQRGGVSPAATALTLDGAGRQGSDDAKMQTFQRAPPTRMYPSSGAQPAKRYTFSLAALRSGVRQATGTGLSSHRQRQ